MSRLSIEIVSNDLESRIQKAKETGQCGDWEVLEHLGSIKSVRWFRDGKRIRTSAIAAAINQGFEIRPDKLASRATAEEGACDGSFREDG